ncbi:unnamed protein product [Tilletia laevis]|uniref:Uncharacterized protein n=2 Tax=Tilletia TaxID=13289 RepID=A0A177TXQ4_9BASI|nr:hypothetical protein CF335_g6124 [Tilletia laevis]KAE8247173.1 hypothetical protein A4X03_0g7122 [Tilletia caries]CAD6910778.1 unnamed protein product [Tilletia controversa]CAD6889345.1 unnamed protein product [Tilletia caries]CAD6920427.1 unnamed protein product [Tilletia caries]
MCQAQQLPSNPALGPAHHSHSQLSSAATATSSLAVPAYRHQPPSSVAVYRPPTGSRHISQLTLFTLCGNTAHLRRQTQISPTYGCRCACAHSASAHRAELTSIMNHQLFICGSGHISPGPHIIDGIRFGAPVVWPPLRDGASDT